MPKLSTGRFVNFWQAKKNYNSWRADQLYARGGEGRVFVSFRPPIRYRYLRTNDSILSFHLKISQAKTIK
jgi:hypothetical protein